MKKDNPIPMIDRGTNADLITKDERWAMDVISYAKKNNPRGIKYYEGNIHSFSPHSSDSEGTSSYKKLRREMILEKRDLNGKIA